MGARGNSGVILSQIFRGFSMAMEGKDEINVEEFARAWDSGREIAYKAVMRPVEGTVLTVIRESSTALMEHVHEMRSIEQAMDFGVKVFGITIHYVDNSLVFKSADSEGKWGTTLEHELILKGYFLGFIVSVWQTDVKNL